MADVQPKGELRGSSATDAHLEAAVGAGGYDIAGNHDGFACIGFRPMTAITDLTVRTAKSPGSNVTFGPVAANQLEPIVLTQVISCTPDTDIRFYF